MATSATKRSWNMGFELLRRSKGEMDEKRTRLRGPWHPRTFQMRTSSSSEFVRRFALSHKLDYHGGCVNTIHFNETGTLLASGSDDLKIVVWDWMANKAKIAIPTDHRSNVFQAKFMPSCCDNIIVSAARDGQIFKTSLCYDGSVREKKNVASHRGAAHKLGLIGGNPHVFLSCGEDAVVFSVDLREDEPQKLLTVKESNEGGRAQKIALYTIFCDPSNPNLFATAGRDQYARIYDRRKIEEDVEPVVKFCPPGFEESGRHENITCLVYSNNGNELLCSYNDEDIYLFDTRHSSGAEPIKSYSGHRNSATVKGVNFYGPSSEYIVSGSDCGHVFLWDKETGDVIQFLEGDIGGVVNCLEPHPFGAFLATSGLDHDVKIWMPTAQTPTDLDGLEECIEKNMTEREAERQIPHYPYPIHQQILQMLMRSGVLRRGDDVSSDTSEDEDNDEDNDDDERDACRPS